MSSPFTPPDTEHTIAGPSALELLWINNRGTVLGSIGGACVLIFIVLALMISNRNTQRGSETALSNAANEADWSALISKYPRTPAAADAMLLLAASLRNSGKLEESDALYSRFTETFPKYSLAVSGLIGRASNARVSNHADLAVSYYQQAASGFPQSYGAPFALFNNAGLLAQQGKIEEAKRIFQTLATQYSGSVIAQSLAGSGASRN
jgi:tetratricopeptide (TPR) repeat protein